MHERNPTIWEGIYEKFDDVKSNQSSPFEEELWLSKLTNQAAVYQNIDGSFKSTPAEFKTYQYIIPLVIGLNYDSKSHLDIVDFGGGLGTTYFMLKSSTARNIKLNYHIIETNAVYEKGLSIHNKNQEMTFHHNFPELKTPADISHCASSLHYIENWKATIENLLGYNPKFLILDDLPAGDIKTSITSQIYYQHKIPVWLFNINGIIDFISSYRYKLVYKSQFIPIIRGKKGKLPTQNLPKEYQLDYTYQLVFINNN